MKRIKRKLPPKKRVYLDYTSATPVDAKVRKAMLAVAHLVNGNPNALHKEGREAKKVLEDARSSLALGIHARADEITFTSGATESNNLAILGLYKALIDEYKKAGAIPHIITTSIEHKSVLEPILEFEKKGVAVTYLDPDAGGKIDPNAIRKELTPSTMLVSVIHAHNEIGTINDIELIAKEVRHAKRKLPMKVAGTPYLMSDAAQSLTYLALNTEKLGADLLTLHSPKVYGPAGIGLLYKKAGTPLRPIIFGGGQEAGLRSGRELPELAHGFAKAYEIAQNERERESKRLAQLRDYLFERILLLLPGAKINGDKENRLPNNVNVCIPGLDAEFAVLQLDEKGIACSSASTCMNNADDSYSYVIEKLYRDRSCAASSLRFSLGRETRKKDVDVCLKALKEVLLTQRILA